jgi:hypothetical protein
MVHEVLLQKKEGDRSTEVATRCRKSDVILAFLQRIEHKGQGSCRSSWGYCARAPQRSGFRQVLGQREHAGNSRCRHL